MKESFSSRLVYLLAKTWGLGGDDLLLDPFCGAGTTPLACKELGIDCVSYEVHPVFLFAASVKLHDYQAGELRKSVKEIAKARFESVGAEVPGFIQRVFPKHLLADVCFLKHEISKIEPEEIRGFLLLGLLNAIFSGGGVHKDGVVLKVRKKPAAPFREVFRRELLQMCTDVERFKSKACEVRVEYRDARNLALEDESVGAVITSPPYLQKGEYIRAYALEEWLFGLGGPKPEELIGVRPEGAPEEDFSEIGCLESEPLEAKFYFKDMFDSLQELHRVCKPGAKVCVVASDGCFPEGVIEVCTRLSGLAENAGFKPKKIVVVNERWCTTPSRRKLGIARESLLFWEKPS
jgi:DNA modification methylase